MRAKTIFYLLAAYILLQFFWWAYLLVVLDPAKWHMIIGEGVVFLGLLIFGAYRLQKAISEEIALNQQQRNFLLSVTHELKSPLAAIKLYLQTIQKRDLDKEKRDTFIQNSLLDIERLDDLVENMLIATKIENNSYTYPKEPLNFSELTQQCVDRVLRNCQDKCQIKSNIQPDIHLIGDAFALNSVVNNLLENAIKYSKELVPIEVVLKQEEERVILSVSDFGTGIPDNEKTKIFDKFYRVGTEDTRKSRGTGLGLFIVKQVLDNHSAQIKVSNNQPSGSIFEVTFNQN